MNIITKFSFDCISSTAQLPISLSFPQSLLLPPPLPPQKNSHWDFVKLHTKNVKSCELENKTFTTDFLQNLQIIEYQDIYFVDLFHSLTPQYF